MPHTAIQPTGTLMAGKRGLIMGVANDRSIAWGIAAACAAQGAELAFTFQGEALEKRVRPLAASVGSDLVFPATSPTTPASTPPSPRSSERWDRLDFLVHAIGFADKEYLRGRYLDTPRATFLQALDISCYSFTAVCQRAVPMMKPGGSLLTLTYLGAERVMPHYNVMGVAKAALEASVRYLAADLGGAGHPGQRDLRRPDQDAGRQRHRRFPLHPALEPAQLADAAQRHAPRKWAAPASTCCPIFDRRHGRGAPRRLRLPFVGMKNPAAPRHRDCRRGLKASGAGHVRQQLRPSVPRHHLGREPRPGDRLRGRRLPAAPAADRGRHPALARPPPARASRASPPSGRSRTRSASSPACSRA